MFSSGPNYAKLKTNLRLGINRLKLLEKKKTELAQKARKEIADYLSTGKIERAKIRVEHIIREDYLVEAMEVTEMYCDLLLARYGLIQQMKDLDEGMAESISSLIWVAPRIQTDVQEIKIIADQLALKYGKPYAQACREQQVNTISEKLIHKLSVQAPPKVLVEKYLVEIAKNYNIEYEPDPQFMREAEWNENPLIALDDGRNNLGGNGGSNSGGASGGMNIPLGFEANGSTSQGGFNYPAQTTDHRRSYPMQYPLLPPNMHSHVQQLQDKFVPSIFLTNPQSLANCFDEFSAEVRKHNPDVAAVAETWFSESQPSDDFQLADYVLFNADRDNKRGGGVALYVRRSLAPYEPTIKIPLDLECIWVGIGGSLFICALYNPPRSPTAKTLLDHLANAILDLRQRVPCARVIVIGDFNHFPHERLYANLCLTNLVQEPTHMNSAIDLILTDAPTLFNKPQILPPISKSQHHCVLVTSVVGENEKEINLPNIPMSPYNPPPPDMSADTMGKNTQVDNSSWDEMLGIDNPPPPPYTTADRNPHARPTAPYPSLPPGGAGPLPPKGPLPYDLQSDSGNGANMKETNQPKPSPRSKFDTPTEFNMPELPSVPDLPSGNSAPDGNDAHSDDVDFDDLNRRFEQLKKKK